MPITGQGWELHVERLGIHRSGGNQRTYGSYQAYLNGAAIEGLGGFICERVGPGDNTNVGKAAHARIAAGQYPLWTQFGAYRSIGYSTNTHVPEPPMPAILVGATNQRTGILIHPAHPPRLYLSSIGCFNPTGPLSEGQTMDFSDSRARVIALLDSLRGFSPAAFHHEAMTHISGASLIVDGEPMAQVPAAHSMEMSPLVLASTPVSMPISKSAALTCASWMMNNFGPSLRNAVKGRPYGLSHLCGIVCQETAYKWVKWIGTIDPQQIVERCVFDASGDYPGTSRSAFPVNTAAFRKAVGDATTDMLIEEANKTRRMQGWSDQQWVYKGYGIFQFDLQHYQTDPDFFVQKQWYDFEACLKRVCRELDDKLVASKGDLWDAIRRYNGKGAKAKQYAENVKAFSAYCAEITG